jgi:endonuclease-3
MKRLEKILELKNYLSGLYPQTGVFLHADTDFHFLIAVILSAQAMDRVVNAVVPGLFAAYPDIPSLAEAPYEDVLAKIRKVGLGPSKAKNIIALAKVLHEQYGDEIPLQREELETLPGIGHKTSGVFLAERHGAKYIPVDTHIERITKRLRIVQLSSSPSEIEAILEKYYPYDDCIEFHRQMILFGRNVCLASSSRKCETCPLRFCMDRKKEKD